MQKYEMNFIEFERILKKRYKIVVFCTMLVVFFSVLFLRSQAHLFQASSAVKIDRSNSMGGLMQEFMLFNTWDNIETQGMVITSFPVMEITARRMKIIPADLSADAIKNDETVLRKIKALNSKVSAVVRGQSNIIDITTTSTDRDETKMIANTVAYSYKDFIREERNKRAYETRVFIEKQLENCRENLAKSENQLKVLKEGDQRPSLDEKMNTLIKSHAELEANNEGLQRRITGISRQIGELEKRKANPFSDQKPKTGDARLGSNIDWVSNIEENDPGLQILNQNLLQLEILKSEKMNYYKEKHPEISDLETRSVDIIDQIVREYRSRLEMYDDQFQDNQAKLNKLQEALRNIPSEQLLYARYLREVKVNEELYTLLATKLQEAMINEAGNVDEVTIISHAVTPFEPFNISFWRTLFLALVIGIMLGFVIALVQEALDTSIGTIEDMENYLKIPVIGVIPHTEIGQLLDKLGEQYKHIERHQDLVPGARLVVQFDPKSPAAEAYRSLRTNLQFLNVDRAKTIKTILFTSSVMQEGKSTTLSNLAIAMAQAGMKILILGCNLRRPSDFRIFGLPSGPGVTDILIGKEKWQNCIRTVKDMIIGKLQADDLMRTPGLENLNIITFGSIPPNPSEMISSKAMDTLLEEVKPHYDLVLVDCTPVLPVTDSTIMSAKVDATVLIYQVGRVPRNALARTKSRLESVKTNVIGLVLNDTKAEMSGYFHSYQKYYISYYGDDPSKTKIKKKRKVPSSAMAFLPAVLSGLSVLRLLDLARNNFLMTLAVFFTVSFTSFAAIMFKRSPEKSHPAPAVLPAPALAKALPPVAVSETPPLPVPEEGPSVWYIQLSSWKTPDQAQADLNKLKGSGYNAYIRDISIPGKGEFYRVCLGEFDRKEYAGEALNGLAPSFPNAMVTR
jgi:tyrosine-protein kinase Etk/Wzc